ncbi:MAG: A/G-specific adenine glycosylase [Anaerolineae bacterium]|nr:A/G-specific adenine glycosylase [Anaerolineae bacterium]
MSGSLADRLLTWYADNPRELPWRGHPDAYAVWVSEIMCQQTRVETAIPYFERWMALFPSVAVLAAASQQQVLSAWEGLGYYGRARNLHKAAQIVVAEFGGQLPADLAALQRLPGIGRYTAAAIASLAFGMDAAVVDGNVKRVLARLFDIHTPVDSTAGIHQLWNLAAEILPAGRAGDHNQALMDLGARVCTPRRPACDACPLIELCQAHTLGVQADRPVTKPKVPTPHYTVAAAVIRRSGNVLISQRPQHALLGGMWEFPGGKLEDGEDLPACLRREINEELGVAISVGEPLGVYRHAYTHFRVTVHAFACHLLAGVPQALQVADLRWVEPAAMASYPMGKVDRRIANRLLAAAGG